MIAGAFDHSDGARVAYCKALARHTFEIGLPGDRAIKYGIADDDVLGRLAACLRRLADNQAPAR